MTATTNPPPARPMPGWLKGGLLAALVFAACWGIAIWYWRETDNVPSTASLVTYLLALPSALVGASWLAREQLIKSVDVPAVAAAHQHIPASRAQPPLAILAASLRMPHGESPEALSAALVNNTARADLDPELVDDDGYPLMTARNSDATDDAMQEEMTEWWTAHGVPVPSDGLELWRALTMATAVVGELASRAACDLMPAEGAPPMLQLIPILPSEWSIDDRRVAGAWFTDTVEKFGWPQERIALVEEKYEFSSPGQIFGRLMQGAPTGVPVVALVVACASNIGEETVVRWVDDRTLFTSSHPQGLIPGEGAAGLLVTDLGQARMIEGALFTLLDPPAEACRHVSADDTRRADSTVLVEVIDRALKPAGAHLSDVAMLVADTGHRASRVLELMGFASGAMPQLDGVADVIRVGAASGTCGHVPYMAALALGNHHALERNAPVLCISNEDSYRRCSVLIRPAESVDRPPHASA